MNRKIEIGIIGDYNPELISHPTTGASIEHAAAALDITAGYEWLPTPTLINTSGIEKLARFDGVWVSSGSPYISMEGALAGIRFARESGRPFFAT